MELKLCWCLIIIKKTKLFKYSNTARFAYNWAISKQQENYKNGGEFIRDGNLRKEFTQLKKQEGFRWLNNVSNDIPKQAIKDACNSYKKFFSGKSKYPKFKSKKKSKPSFYQDNFKIQFTENHVFLSTIGLVKLAERNRLPIGKGKNKTVSVINARVTYDGLHWWISVGIEIEDEKEIPVNKGIGIDLGIKDLAIVSNGSVYKNINKTNKIKKIKKKQRRLQRKVSRQYLKNKKEGRYCKTSNIIKGEKQLKKVQQRLNGIRQNHLHQTTTEIVKAKPSYIVMEDLNVKGMMKNRHLAKAVAEQSFYEFYRQIQYKSEWNNIEFVTADRFFPSIKLCSVCCNIKSDLKLSERIYIFSFVNVIDRDYQASVNLANYYKLVS